ncbi:MAG: hypothetical protein MHM6MM_003844 [Cercozoa sp. M6MM]
MENRQLPKCPLCSQHVLLKENEDVDTAVSRHIESGCRSNIAKRRESPKCGVNTCQSQSLMLVRCRECGHGFCPSHRLPSAHECVEVRRRRALKERERRDKERRKVLKQNAMQSVLARLRNSGILTSRTSSKRETSAATFDKKKAKGRAGVKEENRVYFVVKLGRGVESPLTKRKKVSVYFRADKSLGAAIDDLCQAFAIPNSNASSRASAGRLNLYIPAPKREHGAPKPPAVQLPADIVANELAQGLPKYATLLLRREQTSAVSDTGSTGSTASSASASAVV